MNRPQDADAALATVRAVIAERAHLAGALLPILHGVQDAIGHIPSEAVPEIARALNLSRAEVHGVITYYHHFRAEPAGRHVLQVCRAESCQARGGEALLAQARERLGCSADVHRSADGAWSVEPVYCLGLCASSPAIQIDERQHARVTATRLDALLDATEARDAASAMAQEATA
ncbi:NADH dehydrogenase (ubiquinone) 24 kDa subunit [Leptothrix cholodnii SP-6]|uniref:NADH dehydrogenase (Ubiquinone) 24 kDa subunit n=1 Tax=Leptothrix cholodnii (strain ATCC 51168 / LMG 8142 / SP-6) TaxID=395495 RepID=B1XWL6_LEPCP|nr:formate dehydrogenase subunit gamma [Leptothrix cholodnii]ACB35017.1 NADH dehydrogenase (ubiquinone) 24 kDa subunit [Leptothrix cholodnii SP-6]